ncbi:MAG: hypothetical protein IR158_17515 [Cellulomonas sp.]|uniref:hypothetical protein n=1 Tax=Cellulomonas sp. TaxID=40001 RepID=UPI0019D97487|nr:hypothetical protein [Cellulomonas sp.]MBF0689551.1 hypothetical protein [Cellulomonas sp.]
MPAGELETGDLLVDPDGAPVTIAAVEHGSVLATVHNLTVETDHNYVVATSGSEVVTHNESPQDALRRAGGDAAKGGVCPSDEYIEVHRAPQRGNRPDELRNGLDSARHTTGDRSAYVGSQDVASKWADYATGTHEDGCITFTFRKADC